MDWMQWQYGGNPEWYGGPFDYPTPTPIGGTMPGHSTGCTLGFGHGGACIVEGRQA